MVMEFPRDGGESSHGGCKVILVKTLNDSLKRHFLTLTRPRMAFLFDATSSDLSGFDATSADIR